MPVERRPYLSLLLELLTESPIRRPDGVFIPHEEVVAALESDTVNASTGFGAEACGSFACGSFSHTIVLSLKVDYRKYARGIQWIVDLLQNTEFTAERIRVCGAKTINTVAQAKRNGRAVTKDLMQSIFYAPDNNNIRTSSMLQQHKFLTAVLAKLETEDGVRSVIDDLNALRAEIILPERLALYVAADWKKIESLDGGDLVEPWLSVVKSDTPWE